MKEENYKPLGFLAAIILLTFGLVFLGQSGIKAIESGEPQTEETGQLLSLRMTAFIQFLFGLIATVTGILIYSVLQRRKKVFEE